jgi:hypothetical protein
MKLIRFGNPGEEKPGLNFRDHAAETGAQIPQEPVIFMKATSALSGPNDDVIIPRNSAKTDWEVELGIERLGSSRQRLRAYR